MNLNIKTARSELFRSRILLTLVLGTFCSLIRIAIHVLFILQNWARVPSRKRLVSIRNNRYRKEFLRRITRLILKLLQATEARLGYWEPRRWHKGVTQVKSEWLGCMSVKRGYSSYTRQHWKRKDISRTLVSILCVMYEVTGWRVKVKLSL
jgi:hypothetical protein